MSLTRKETSFPTPTISRRQMLAAASISALYMLLPKAVKNLENIRSRWQRTDLHLELSPGVDYFREAINHPHPIMVHRVMVDLNQPDLHFYVSPGNSQGGRDAVAQTGSQFLSQFNKEEHDFALALNANFYFPINQSLFNRYPQSGDPVDVWGLAISDGHQYSDPKEGFNAVCILNRPSQAISFDGESCADGTQQAIAGITLVKDGQNAIPFEDHILHPRTAIYLTGDKMIGFVSVDGRQGRYSRGASNHWLGGFLAHEKEAEAAVGLDGGGSNYLGLIINGEIDILNRPINNKIPYRQRPNANFIGIYRPSVTDD
jgi:hypothetical protein